MESLWYLYYFTKDPIYKEWGASIFEAIEKFSKHKNGYAVIKNTNERK